MYLFVCFLSPYVKINPKCIEDLNIRPGTVNYIEENIGTKLMNLLLIEDFVNMTPKASEVKAQINEWDYIKLKSFCTAKESSNKPKREPTE